ncbi:MAG: hypothetical protein ACYSU7_11020 [Planctomycetota bacterium]
MSDEQRNGRRIEVPREMVWCQDVTPFERKSNGVVMVPVRQIERRWEPSALSLSCRPEALTEKGTSWTYNGSAGAW